MFHKHKWVELERFWAPSRENVKIPAWVLEESMTQIFFGVTTILYKCSICPKIKTVEVLGQSLKEKKP